MKQFGWHFHNAFFMWQYIQGNVFPKEGEEKGKTPTERINIKDNLFQAKQIILSIKKNRINELQFDELYYPKQSKE